MAVKITASKKKEFEEELKLLKTEGRANAVKKIQEARAFGDLSENAEYDIAKAEQGKLEARIVELESVLRNCEIIEEKNTSGSVDLGCTVEIRDTNKNIDKVMQIVGVYESDPMAEPKRISNESPLGKVVIGKKLGEKFVFEHNGKKTNYLVVKIS